MANETLITDLVAQEALDQLNELDRAMEGTLEQFKQVAQELAKGVKIPVEVSGDLEKLNKVYETQVKRAGEATQQLNQQIQQQQQIVANTTNTISRQLMEQEKLNKAQREAYTQGQQSLDVADRILGTHEQNIKRLAELNGEMKSLKEQYKAGAVSAEEYTRRELELKTAKQELQRILNNETKMNQAAAGSYQQLSLQLERMKQAQKQLNEEEKRGAEGQALEKEIQALDAHLKDLAADMGEFQRNVGNYAVAGQSLKSTLKELTNEIAQLTLQYEELSDEEKRNAVGTQMREKITRLTEEAGRYKDTIDDVKQSIRGSASDTRWFDTLAESGRVLASSLGLAQTAAQALGMSEDSLQESMLKVQQAMQAVQALQVIQNTLQKQSNLMKGIGIIQSKALAAAEALEASTKERGVIATKAATVAQKALNLVAKANPYLLLATAIGAVVAAMFALSSRSKDATKNTEKLTEAIQEQGDEFGNARVKLLQLRQEWDTLTSDKAREEWVRRNQDAFKELGVSINNAKEAENLLVRNTSTFIQAMTLRAEAAANAAAAQKEFQAAVEGRMSANSRRGNPTAMDKFKGILNVGWDFDFSGSIARESSRAAGAMERAASEAEVRAEKYIKQQYDLLRRAESVMKSGGFRAASSASGGSSSASSKSGGTSAKSVAEAKKEAEALRKRVEELINEGEEMVDEQIARMAKKAIEAYSVITSTNQEEYDENVTLVKKAYADQKALLEEQRKKAVEEKAKEYNEVIAIAKSKKENTQKLEEAMTNALTNISDEYNERIIDNTTEMNETLADMAAQRVALAQQEREQEIAATTAEYQVKLGLLRELYLEELRQAEGNEKKIQEVRKRYAQESAQLGEQQAIGVAEATITGLEKVLEMEELTDEQRAEIAKKLADEKEKLAKAVADHEENELDRTIENEQDARDKRNEAIQNWAQKMAEAISEVSDLFSAMYDGQIAKIEEQMEAEQARYDKEVEHIEYLAERGAITSEEAEIRKRDAEAATAAKQEQLEKKKAQIEYKKAVAEKANSIAQIGIATALGIMKAAPNWVNMALVAAMGAIQTATALAQPIKAYKEGTKGRPHPGGLAIVGDGGKTELVTFDGRSWLTPDTATLVDLPKGAEVFPDVTQEDVERMGATLTTVIPRDKSTGQPVIINDYTALEGRVAANTKAMGKYLTRFEKRMTKELKRQRFAAYLDKRI